MKKVPTISEHHETKIPERNLWAKVLEISIRDALKGSSSARNWILSSSTKPRSFMWTCEVLEFDSKELRKVIINNDKGFLKRI